jgi:hypothetical protein
VVAAQRKLVSRIALIGLVALAGCFYMDPVNQRPSLDIARLSTDHVFRGGEVPLRAVSNDPDGHFVFFHWRAYVCTDQSDCDAAPYFELSEDLIDLPVPKVRAELEPGVPNSAPVQWIRVVLEGQDDFGATAKPAQELWITVENYAPTLKMNAYSDFGFVVTKEVRVFVEVTDIDDGPEVPALTWQVYTPVGSTSHSFVDLPAEPGPAGTKAYGKLLTPDVIGKYTIEVTATDNIAPVPSVQRLDVMILPDRAPCLRTLSPIVATAPNALPITEPTLFQVHVVADDLDPYPGSSTGTTSFSWSLLGPTGPRAPLTGVTGNRVSINPAAYQPGDIVELRVEIADRNNTAIMCADSSPTCSVITDNNCLQRQTWRVEVR